RPRKGDCCIGTRARHRSCPDLTRCVARICYFFTRRRVWFLCITSGLSEAIICTLLPHHAGASDTNSSAPRSAQEVFPNAVTERLAGERSQQCVDFRRFVAGTDIL